MYHSGFAFVIQYVDINVYHNVSSARFVCLAT